MTKNGYFTSISIRPKTSEQIRSEADATGMKVWALVDRMVENYFSEKARNV